MEMAAALGKVKPMISELVTRLTEDWEVVSKKCSEELKPLKTELAELKISIRQKSNQIDEISKLIQRYQLEFRVELVESTKKLGEKMRAEITVMETREASLSNKQIDEIETTKRDAGLRECRRRFPDLFEARDEARQVLRDAEVVDKQTYSAWSKAEREAVEFQGLGAEHHFPRCVDSWAKYKNQLEANREKCSELKRISLAALNKLAEMRRKFHEIDSGLSEKIHAILREGELTK